jgi:hypothetical protein
MIHTLEARSSAPPAQQNGILGGRRVQPMRQVAFKTIGSVSASMVQMNLAIGNAIASSVAWCFNQVNAIIAATARFLMRRLDEERFDYYSSLLSQQSELGELQLLMAARKVKEDALKGRVWTTMHTIAINKIAGALHYNCGWEPPRIHQYLREVVESIPGMVYGTGDDFEPH